MAVVDLLERDAIAAFCRRNPFLHVYELGDLDDFFWPHTRWFGWEEDGVLGQLALLYTEPPVPVLLALAERPHRAMARLLADVLPMLPDRLYAHVTPALLGALEERYEIEQHGLHLKLGLTGTDRLPAGTAELMGSDQIGEVEAFYARAYPGTWFQPRMLESGRYVGLREGDALACVAGVHVYSPTWRVAALGNVATAPELRGRGLATRACGALCRLLLDDGIETIGLNVRADNLPAIAAYRKLGFEVVAEYVEASLGLRST